MAFVGREAELAALRDWWANRPDRPALVWGRRRVGKTALIERFAEGLPRVVFHTGDGDLASAELGRLAGGVQAAGLTRLRDLTANPYHDWYDALEHLANEADREPALLVLDEFPELLHGTPTLPGILRAFLDRSREHTKLRILICGSAVRTMWSIQESRAPLYGRFNLTLPVYPLRPREAAMMLSGLAPEDRALVYGLFGGMPLYLSWWNQGQSFAENILPLALSPGSPMLTEGRLILQTEVGSDQGGAVLSAIAAGATKFSEVEDRAGFPPARAIDRLLEARLISRIVPVGEDPAKSRRTIYRVSDNFLSFYLGPLRKYRTAIERGRGQAVLPAIERELDNFMGLPYEEAFRECLWEKAFDGTLGISDVVDIGPWWTGGGQDQIDAVVLAEPELTRVPVAVGESKWARSVNGARQRAKLTVKAAALTADVDRLVYIVCGRSEVVTQPGSDTIAITAADIFPDPS
jgi:uncharacterized protein